MMMFVWHSQDQFLHLFLPSDDDVSPLPLKNELKVAVSSSQELGSRGEKTQQKKKHDKLNLYTFPDDQIHNPCGQQRHKLHNGRRRWQDGLDYLNRHRQVLSTWLKSWKPLLLTLNEMSQQFLVHLFLVVDDEDRTMKVMIHFSIEVISCWSFGDTHLSRGFFEE